MKNLVNLINERKDDTVCTLPQWCDIVKISPNDYDGSVEFMTVVEVKKNKSLEKVGEEKIKFEKQNRILEINQWFAWYDNQVSQYQRCGY